MSARIVWVFVLAGVLPSAARAAGHSSETPPRHYRIVGTGQSGCYDNQRAIVCPSRAEPFYGQDAQAPGPAPAYHDNGDGTISDLNTGLMWVRARGDKIAWDDAVAGARASRVGGYQDWRMPNIKELYSLIHFNGGHHPEGGSIPYLDTRYFDFRYGNVQAGERAIDCQDWSATEYLGTTMRNDAAVFGVNFADGRIKGYPRYRGARGTPHRLYVRYVRGKPDYGRNDFIERGDGIVLDRATGLEWSKVDSRTGMDWPSALAWVQKQNRENYLGHNDWRLPNAKEIQSIVDYTRAPLARRGGSSGAAIDPAFEITTLADGEYPYFWSSTTHLDGPRHLTGSAAVYIAFGRALGSMRLPGDAARHRVDVHGAGAQRSDPKTGDPAAFPAGRGPQGDEIRIRNFVRLVRGPEPEMPVMTVQGLEPH